MYLPNSDHWSLILSSHYFLHETRSLDFAPHLFCWKNLKRFLNSQPFNKYIAFQSRCIRGPLWLPSLKHILKPVFFFCFLSAAWSPFKKVLKAWWHQKPRHYGKKKQTNASTVSMIIICLTRLCKWKLQSASMLLKTQHGSVYPELQNIWDKPIKTSHTTCR